MSTNTEQTENNVKSSESRNRSSGALLFLRVMIKAKIDRYVVLAHVEAFVHRAEESVERA